MNDLFYINDEMTPTDQVDDFVSDYEIPGHPEIPVADGVETSRAIGILEVFYVDGKRYHVIHAFYEDGRSTVAITEVTTNV